MTKNHFLSLIAVAILVGGLSFYGGVQYAKGSTPPASTQGSGQGGGSGFRGGRNGGGANGSNLSGSILSKDAQSITLSLRDGGSKIVFYSGTTEISKFVAGTADDLAVGANVMVNGTANSDGSVTSKMIQIRPANAPGAGAGQGQGQGQTQGQNQTKGKTQGTTQGTGSAGTPPTPAK
jgi:hypothetical protein